MSLVLQIMATWSQAFQYLPSYGLMLHHTGHHCHKSCSSLQNCSGVLCIMKDLFLHWPLTFHSTSNCWGILSLWDWKHHHSLFLTCFVFKSFSLAVSFWVSRFKVYMNNKWFFSIHYLFSSDSSKPENCRTCRLHTIPELANYLIILFGV